jgi:Predicted transmembrane sensor domain
MAGRGILFGLTALLAAGTALAVHFSERNAVQEKGFWPGVTEMRARDMLSRLLLNRQAHPDVVIVAADDKSVQEYGALPWERSIWASALRNVQSGGAKVAAFDIALDTRTKDREDAALWRAMANGRRAVLGFGVDAEQTRWTPDDVRALRFLEKFAIVEKLELPVVAAQTSFPWAYFDAPVSDFTQAARGAGVFVRETDPDGVIRHARSLYLSEVADPPNLTAPLPGKFPITKLEGAFVTLTSLPVATATAALQADKDNLAAEGGNLRLTPPGKTPTRIPVDTSTRMAIRYAGPAGTFPRHSLVDVARGKVPPATFENKVVLFGATADGAKETDRRMTPEGLMPRVEITANAVSNILSGHFLASARGYAAPAILMVLGLIAGAALARRTAAGAIKGGLLVTALYLVAAWIVASVWGLVFPLTPALLFLLLSTITAALILRAAAEGAGRRYESLKPVA